MGTTYRIAEVAERSGFTAATLRYYEDIGLVRPAGRTAAGYRVYDDASLQRLRFVARAKQLGCSLDEVAELSTAWEGGRCAHVQQRLRATVEAKVAESQRQVAELTMLTTDLRRAAAGLRASPTGACDDTCGCVAEPAGAPTGPAAAPATPEPGAGGEDACGCEDGCGDAVVDGPPVTCTLDAAGMGDRLAEWAALLDPEVAAGPDGAASPAGVVARSAVDGGVRLVFGPGADVAAIARLAAAEQGCCRFFRFTLTIDDSGVALEARAPAGAGDLVTALFGAP
jgi:DNA-binding transcriptional MerR regulator